MVEILKWTNFYTILQRDRRKYKSLNGIRRFSLNDTRKATTSWKLIFLRHLSQINAAFQPQQAAKVSIKCGRSARSDQPWRKTGCSLNHDTLFLGAKAARNKGLPRCRRVNHPRARFYHAQKHSSQFIATRLAFATACPFTFSSTIDAINSD